MMLKPMRAIAEGDGRKDGTVFLSFQRSLES